LPCFVAVIRVTRQTSRCRWGVSRFGLVTIVYMPPSLKVASPARCRSPATPPRRRPNLLLTLPLPRASIISWGIVADGFKVRRPTRSAHGGPGASVGE
jgi:hypothetical protein